MRILYHHRTLGDGAEGIHVREMIQAFRELGHEVQVIGPTGADTPRTSRKLRALEALKAALPTAAYELAEMTYSAYAFARASGAIRRFRPHFIYDRYNIFNAGIVLAGRANGVPVLLEVNAPVALERRQQPDDTLRFRRLAAAMERWICAHASRALVVSSPLKEYLESIGVPQGQCVVMPNGADPRRFAPREKDQALLAGLGIEPGQLVVGFTGILRAWHGLDLLVDAARCLTDRGASVRFLIVGDGPYRHPLETRIASLGLKEVVRITGRVDHDRVPEYVSGFDVAVSPKSTFYASPMKVIEYMALGKAVVVPRTPNFLDLVDDGLTGLTFENGEAEGLAEAIEVLCSSPELRAKLGRAARLKVEHRLNWQWNAREACKLARELTAPASLSARGELE